MRSVMSALLTVCGLLGVLCFGAIALKLRVAPEGWANWAVAHGFRSDWILYPPFKVVVGCAACSVFAMLAGSSLSSQLGKPLEESTSHGSARFASTEELRRYGYSEALGSKWSLFLIWLRLRAFPHINGVVLGQENTAQLEMYLGDRGGPAFRVKRSAPLIIVREHHVGVEGPPGSGKDVSIALPALWYDYNRSVVVLDPKGDQFATTSGARSALSVVKKFCPTEPDSARFNPLCVVPVGTPSEVTEVEQISNALLGVMKDEKDPSTFYSKSAQPLLSAAILYALHNAPKGEKSLATAFDLLGGGGDPKEKVERISSGLPKSAKYLRDMLKTMKDDKKTIQSMFTTCLNALDFCKDPMVRHATSGSDFVPSDLFARDVPLSLYLVIPFKHADALRPLMRLILNVLIGSHTEKRKRDTCYYLNEFPSIGKVPAIVRAAAEIRAYGVQFALFWQSEGQLIDAYKESSQTILDICRARVLLGVSGRMASENASALAGKTTIVRARETEAVSQKSFLDSTRTRTYGQGEQARELLSPDEVRTLSPDKALVILPYLHPYLATRCVSYAQPRFKRARSVPSPARFEVPA